MLAKCKLSVWILAHYTNYNTLATQPSASLQTSKKLLYPFDYIFSDTGLGIDCACLMLQNNDREVNDRILCREIKIVRHK